MGETLPIDPGPIKNENGTFRRWRSSMKANRVDPFARCPETTEFIVLLPEAIVDDGDRCASLLNRMEAAFPGSRFRVARCERLQDPDGRPLIMSDPLVVPMMGNAGDGSKPEPMRRRPSDARIGEISTALVAFIAGGQALN